MFSEACGSAGNHSNASAINQLEGTASLECTSYL
jgi:hypothetical protein